jgi:aryl-alcohol dehydrogenase-like predicted oxidoreductase
MSEPIVAARVSSPAASEMRYRRLGRTDLRLSIIGFGASPLGDVFGSTDRVEGARAVHQAIDEGINFFDVSPYYGLTLAEERLGQALVGQREKIVLATKCGRYGIDQFDFSSARVRRSIDESLRRLCTDHVDLFQAHDVEFGDAEQIINETIPAMRRLQEEGKTRFVGITGYPLKVLMRIADAIPVDSILSYCRYDLLINDLDTTLIPFADSHGIGVINASPLHMGVLTERGAPDWHPAPPSVHSTAREALSFCQERNVDLSALALGFCLDYSRVASTLVGMSKTSHVHRNLHALRTVDHGLIDQVRGVLAPASNTVWPSGKPENRD